MNECLKGLKELLNQIELPSNTFQMCYEEVMYGGYIRPDENTPSLAEMVEKVSELTPDPGWIAPILEFAWRVSQTKSYDEKVQVELKKLADWVTGIVSPKALLADLKKDIENESKLRKEKRFYRLVVNVPETGRDIDYCLYLGLKVWKRNTISCDDVTDEGSVKQKVGCLIEQTPASLKKEIFCEFILSLNVLLEWQVDQWEYIDLDKNPATFGKEHPVVLRCGSRRKNAERCSEISQRINKTSSLNMCWTPAKLLDDLIDGKRSENCVGIAVAPKPKSQANNNKVFVDVVMSGFPFALWPRGDLEDRFKEQFSKKKLGKCKLDELPHKIKSLRRKNSHWSISVLWDDHLQLLTPLG